MRDPISKACREIQPSGIRKFFDVVSEMPDAISLGVGEPDFDTPWHIREEGIYSLEHGRTYYTSNAGLKELKQEICRYLKRKIHTNYEEKQILVTVGGSEAIDVALRAMVDPGDEVLIPEPCYVSYLPCAQLTYAVPVPIPLQEANEFQLTGAEVEAHCTDKTKVLILPFPNNPTGAVLSRENLADIAKVCVERDLFVISDEIYSELTYGDQNHVSIAEFPGMAERTIVINGFSKAYAMTGWRLGYAAGPLEIIKQMVKIHQFAIMCAPTTSQYAAVEALRNGDDDVKMMTEAYNQRRRYLLHELRRIGMDCFEARGAFYVFPSIKKYGMTSEEFATRLLEEQKVAVVPGSAFGASGEGYIRISYAYSLESLKQALERVEKFVNSLHVK